MTPHPVKEFQRQLKTLANLTLVDIKDNLELSSDDFTKFVHGKLHIDIHLARKLSIMTDTPPGMWVSLNLEN
jgi:plasmid maintenance system antidote protein VapI